MTPGLRPDPASMAICTLAGNTPISTAVLADGAHLDRRSKPSAQTTSNAPLAKINPRWCRAGMALGMIGSNDRGRTKWTIPLAANTPAMARGATRR